MKNEYKNRKQSEKIRLLTTRLRNTSWTNNLPVESGEEWLADPRFEESTCRYRNKANL